MALDLYREFWGITRALDAAGVEYAVVGALALAVHGIPRATTDIDLLVRAESIEDAFAAAEGCGFLVERVPLRFQSGAVLYRANKLHEEDYLTLDLLVVTELLEPAWSSRAAVDAGDGRLWVVSRDALIDMKNRAGRPQDLADIGRLRELDG